MDKLVQDFINRRTPSTELELNEPLYNAIFLLEKSDALVNEICNKNIEKLIANVPWPSMHDMYKRNYEYCCGALGGFLIGQFPSSEALCRIAIEGAVNLHYVSLGDSMAKQIAYFKDHLKTERDQNEKWKKSVENSDYPDDAKKEHFERIVQKEMALNQYDDGLRKSLALAGVNYDSSILKWPSIFDRFREIGKEVGYRTVYVALCSQAHNDAEDILNSFMARVISNVSGMEDAQFVEQYHFSLYMLLTAIEYHVMASAMYIAKFEISAIELIAICHEVIENIILVTENGARAVTERIVMN